MGERIVLATFGSFGDLHPYLALGLELKRRGHDVVVATSEGYRPKVEALGLAFRPVRPNIPDYEKESALMARLMDEKTGPTVVLKEICFPQVRESFEDMRVACEGAALVLGHPLTFGARLVCELTKTRWASSVLAPLSFFSQDDPPVIPGSALTRLPQPFGRWAYALLMKLARAHLGPWSEPLRKLRAELGLPPAPDPLFEGQHSPELVLALFSPVFAPPQRDWAPRTIATGFCFHDEDGAPGLTPELERFLDAGEPPIVFTLGSSAVWNAGAFYTEAAEAAQILRRRAVLVTGRVPRNKVATLPPGVISVEYAPYSALFGRAAAIVHQGGVGTTAQALRSGRPMVVVPFGFDQPDNAARVVRLGVARTLSRGKLGAASLARTLAGLLEDEGARVKAAAVGERVRAEDGPRVAAEALERLLA